MFIGNSSQIVIYSYEIFDFTFVRIIFNQRIDSSNPGCICCRKLLCLRGNYISANDTIAYNGISLGNRVKLRGYVDFVYGYGEADALGDDSRFTTSGDVDFLFDFSPVTGEVHLQASTEDVGLEQLFGRYSFNQDFNLSFGRQLTNLGYGLMKLQVYFLHLMDIS